MGVVICFSCLSRTRDAISQNPGDLRKGSSLRIPRRTLPGVGPDARFSVGWNVAFVQSRGTVLIKLILQAPNCFGGPSLAGSSLLWMGATRLSRLLSSRSGRLFGGLR